MFLLTKVSVLQVYLSAINGLKLQVCHIITLTGLLFTLLSRVTKLALVVERIFEHRILQQIEIDDMQFGFMQGKGTTDAIFMAKQI